MVILLKAKFKTKKRFKSKTFIIFLLTLFFIYNVCDSLILNTKLFSSNEEFINYLLDDDEYYLKYKDNHNLVSYLFKAVYGLDIGNPAEILSDTFSKSYYVSNTTISDDNPRVYIYNSHQAEKYDQKDYEIYNITPNVLMASFVFKEQLEKVDIPVLVEDADILEFMAINNYNFASSYKASKIFIENAIKKNPSLEFFIDIHRDAIKKSDSIVKIDNKNCAKILFVVGLENKTYQKNLDLANTLNRMVRKKYPGLSRGVLTKKGSGVNGVYNQDISPQMILLEIGGYQSTIDEVQNTIKLLAPILKEYLDGK